MRFEVHLRLEDVCLVRLTFCVYANEVSISEVLLQLLVVSVILRLSATISSVAYMASFVLLSAVRVQFVIAVEALFAEATVWMSLEPRLIDRAWAVVTELLMFSQLAEGKKLVFVGEDLFVS